MILTLPDNNAFTKVVADARAKGIIVIAINNDDVTPGHNARQSYIGPAFLASGIALTKQLETLFPKEGPINVLVGVNVPGANWSEQRAAGVVKALDDFKAAIRDVSLRSPSWTSARIPPPRRIASAPTSTRILTRQPISRRARSTSPWRNG